MHRARLLTVPFANEIAINSRSGGYRGLQPSVLPCAEGAMNAQEGALSQALSD